MKAHPLVPACTVCSSGEAARVATNNAIWPTEGDERASKYRTAGVEAFLAVAGRRLDPKTITSHADHVERSWRIVTERAPLNLDLERPVHTDFLSVTEQGARVGMIAMQLLEQRIALLDDKALIATAKLGVASAAKREDSRLRRGEQAVNIAAVFAIVGGYDETPQPDPRDVTPPVDLATLRAELRTERARLVARSLGDDA